MGLIKDKPHVALGEIESLLGGQWENGHIGHITFSKDDTKYFPGPNVWETEKFSPNGIISSGLIQPPLLAVSAAYIDSILRERGEEKEWVDGILDNIIRYHRYLKKHRDSEDSGLLTIIHPWESGTDNSPRWDAVLSQIDIATIPQHVIHLVNTNRTDSTLGNISDRPEVTDYYRYLYLVDMYKSFSWDTKKILQNTPFAVKDTLINAIWAKANMSLARMLQERSRKKEARVFEKWATQTVEALQKSFNSTKKMYALYDVSHGQKREYFCDTIANFLPLYAHAATEEQKEILLSSLTNPKKYWSNYPIPSTPLDSEYFEDSRYWRGPSWPITNLFVIEGLLTYEDSKSKEIAQKILHRTYEMIETFGLFEYYNPQGREEKGIGFATFSWSAAIYLYLTQKYSMLAQTQSSLPAVPDSFIMKA